jgi:predicted flap endonuclease-1-like 5' DNA nuclease
VRRARGEQADAAELERLRGRVANLEPVVAERDLLRAELDELRSERASTHVDPGSPTASAAPDVDLAAEVLGRTIDLDDLTVVEGIGPKIQNLCHGIGIRTWFDLSTTEVSLLRTMLADAGSRFHSQDPSTWPEQAALLAAGRWADFRALADELSGGRAAPD